MSVISALSPSKIVFVFILCFTCTSSTFRFKKALLRSSRERQADSSCPRVRPNTPEFFSDVSSRVNEPTRLRSLYSTKVGARITVTAQEFFKDRSFNGRNQFIPTLHQDIGDACIKKPACDHNAKYRSIDGFCNNLEFPEWGVTGVPLVRIFPAFYHDERESLRTGSDSRTLPRARLLLTSLFPSRSVAEDPEVTYAVMSWGQLISHDTAKVVEQRPDDENGQCLCCSRMGKELPENDSPNSCAPILIPFNDSFYSKSKTTCLNFKRSVTTNDMNCPISPRQFVSDVSHFIDASFLYGSSNKAASRVRLKVGGLLRFQTVNQGIFLPDLGKQKRHCPRSKVCYDAGDDRVNQNPMLTVLHTLFLRLHNRVAKQLEALNSHWSDEVLYQESRKVVVAAVQRISYTEYLPNIISPQTLRQHKLAGTAGMVIDQYDKFLNPGTLVSFTSAAFRIFHSMIPTSVKILNEKRQQVRLFKLSEMFFKPDLIQQDGAFPLFVRGLVTQPTLKLNEGFSTEITNRLFRSSRNGQGLDLVSADIMRGRDHGLPTYNQARISCGLPRFGDFNALSGNFPNEAVVLLKKQYSSVDDIDLYLGAILEKPAEGSKVGPLLQCILIEQFKRWKDGDRYFYTFLNNPGSFTEDQLREVEKLSLSKIICLTTDIENMQPNAFRQPNSRSNKLIPCGTISQLSLGAWKESKR